MTDYAFAPVDGYEVDRNKYERHQPHTYTKQNIPKVCLRMQKDPSSQPEKVHVLVDTGSDYSTLSGNSADSLEISRRPEEGESLFPIKGITGNHVVGYRRKMHVYLGWRFQEVEVVVEPHPACLETFDQDEDEPAVVPVNHDLLGREGVFQNYLLCFDSERLYAFPRRKKKPKRKPK